MTPTQADDIALLRRFEPVLHLTAGERFFPMDVRYYVEECSLWVQRPGEAPECLIPEEEMTLEHLAKPLEDPRSTFEAVYYLRFIEPLDFVQLARYNIEKSRQRDQKDIFRAGSGRLSRVGYGSRLLDALFSLTLFARGRVPGDNAAAAALAYEQIRDEHPHQCYCGRVVRQNGWIVLQYWFFYAYNNWRSGFFGVNDHESDWEQVMIYLYEDEEDIHPAWIAYASHDFSGDDLRRRWDDPEVGKVGEHPIVYPGAGSHASYFQPGEYLTEIEIPFLRPLVRITTRLEKLRQQAAEEYFGGDIIEQAGGEFNLFRIPFVDYGRGNGRTIGPGQEWEWDDPVMLSPTPAWAQNYRGLWGLYTKDPLSGEDAPAGPMYNRDGSVRKAWYDPLGWAGLDKVPPPNHALAELYEQRSEVHTHRAELQDRVGGMNRELMQLGIEAEAVRGQPHLKPQYEAAVEQITALTGEIDVARASLTRDEALLEALDHHAERLQSGDPGPLRAHIARAHHPIPKREIRMGRFAEFWAAISIGLMMVAFVALVYFDPGSLLVGLVVLLGLFLFIEAAFRRWLGRLVTAVTMVLALVAAGILIVNFFGVVASVAVVVLGLYIMIDNLRELASR